MKTYEIHHVSSESVEEWNRTEGVTSAPFPSGTVVATVQAETSGDANRIARTKFPAPAGSVWVVKEIR